MENEINEIELDEAAGNRPQDQDLGDKSAETLDADPAQKKEPSGKNSSRRPADQAGELPDHDPSNLSNAGSGVEVDLDYKSYSTLSPEKTAKAVSEAFAAEVPTFTIGEELGGLMEGDELSEEFQNKIAVIFESAVNAVIREQHEAMVESFETTLAEALETQQEAVEAEVGRYVDYVAEQWLEENKIAVEEGIRSQINESLVSDMLQVFEAHNIDLPEESVDLYEEAVAAREDAETRLQEQVERNIETAQTLAESKKLLALMNFSRENNLTTIQEEQLVSLTEGLEFDSAEAFDEKLNIIGDNYFTEGAEASDDVDLVTEDINVEPEVVTEDAPEKPNNEMAIYASAISRSTYK